jgi:hypothetical protein
MAETRGFFDQRKGLLALYLFGLALLLRVVLNLIFFSRFGWFSSNLIEIWFYYGVARGIFSLSLLDPTFILLRVPGWLLPEGILYQAVAFQAALVSGLTAVFIFYWLAAWIDRETGWWGGVIFALLPAPLTLSLANFSHDLVQVPMVVLFFWCAASIFKKEEKRIRRIAAFLLAFLVVILGLKVGPLMAAAVVVALFYALWLLFRSLVPGNLSRVAAIFFLLFLILVNLGLGKVMQTHLLEWMAPLALKFRGIDLASQVSIKVGDLQPLPRDGLWNRYNIFIFFLPWGLGVAWKKREYLSLALLFFSLALALAVNRGARLLDLAVVFSAALAISNWNRKALGVTLSFIFLFLLLNFAFPGAARNLYLGMPFRLSSLWGRIARLLAAPDFAPEMILRQVSCLISGFIIIGIVWPFLINSRRWWLRFFPLVVLAVLQAAWVLVAASPSSDQLEYDAYRRLDRHSQPGEKIFAAWNQGFFIRAVTHLEPITSPDCIDFPLTRNYWKEEKAAWQDLKSRGIDYVHISTRYFGVTEVDPARDTFQIRGNTIIGPRPDHIRRYSKLRETLLFRLNYEPRGLKYFHTIYDEFDPARTIGVRIFKLK